MLKMHEILFSLRLPPEVLQAFLEQVTEETGIEPIESFDNPTPSLGQDFIFKTDNPYDIFELGQLVEQARWIANSFDASTRSKIKPKQ
jgi:hypothetical protein